MKNYRNLLSTLIAVSALLSISLGCRAITDRLKENSERTEPVTGTSGEPGGRTQPGSSSSAAGDLSKKTNLYISKCLNQYSSSIMNSYRRYTSWVKDPAAGPTGKERIIYGLYEVRGDGTDCAAAITEANAAAPDMPEIEQAGERYADAAKEAASQVTAVYAYYDQEDYKDDGFQKGKAAHPTLMAAFEKFETANREFSDQVDKLEDEVANARLEEYRDDPSKKFHFAVTDFNIKAKKAMIYSTRTEYAQLSADTLQGHADEIEKAAAEMKTAGSGKATASSYMSEADQFIKSVKDLMRRVRDKKPFDSFERDQLGTFAGWMVEGSPDKVVHQYNSLIRSRSFLMM